MAAAAGLSVADRQRIAEMAAIVAQVTTQVQKGSAEKKASFVDKITSKFWEDPLKYGFYGLAAGAVYSFGPTQWLVSKAVSGLSQALGYAAENFTVHIIPPALQSAATYVGYEWVRTGKKPGEAKAAEKTGWEIPKHVAVAGLAIGIDEVARETAQAVLLAPAVRNTLGVCLAVDYVNAAIKDGAVVPKNVVSLAKDVKQKTEMAADYAWKGLNSAYSYLTSPSAKETVKSGLSLIADGFKNIYDYSKEATLIGTAAAVCAASFGLPGLGTILTFATGVPLGFSCQKIVLPSEKTSNPV
jgi:hypothetical protein